MVGMGFLKNCKFPFQNRGSGVDTGVPILALCLSAALHLGVLLWVFGVSWPAGPAAGDDGAEIVTVMLETEGHAAPGLAIARVPTSAPSDVGRMDLQGHSSPSDLERTDPQVHLPTAGVERAHSRPDPVLSDAVQARLEANPALPEARQTSLRTNTVSRDGLPTRSARPVDVKPHAASTDRASVVAERAPTVVASSESRFAHDDGVAQGPPAAPVSPAGGSAQAADGGAQTVDGAARIAGVGDAVAQDLEPPRVVAQADYLGQRPMPAYPPQSERRGEQGRVVLRVLISAQGRPVRIDVRTSSGYPRLDQAAVMAVRQAHFRPYQEDGVAYRALVDIPFDFVL